MSKIDEIKNKAANQYVKYDLVNRNKWDYTAGFDAAMELQFLFMRWVKKESWNYSDNGLWFKQHEAFEENNTHKTEEELYDYFLENIYPNQQP